MFQQNFSAHLLCLWSLKFKFMWKSNARNISRQFSIKMDEWNLLFTNVHNWMLIRIQLSLKTLLLSYQKTGDNLFARQKYSDIIQSLAILFVANSHNQINTIKIGTTLGAIIKDPNRFQDQSSPCMDLWISLRVWLKRNQPGLLLAGCIVTLIKQSVSSIHVSPSRCKINKFLWSLYHKGETFPSSSKEWTCAIKTLGLLRDLPSSVIPTKWLGFIPWCSVTAGGFPTAWLSRGPLQRLSSANSLARETASCLLFAIRRSYVFSAWFREWRRAAVIEALSLSVMFLWRGEQWIQLNLNFF